LTSGGELTLGDDDGRRLDILSVDMVGTL